MFDIHSPRMLNGCYYFLEACEGLLCLPGGLWTFAVHSWWLLAEAAAAAVAFNSVWVASDWISVRGTRKCLMRWDGSGCNGRMQCIGCTAHVDKHAVVAWAHETVTLLLYSTTLSTPPKKNMVQRLKMG